MFTYRDHYFRTFSGVHFECETETFAENIFHSIQNYESIKEEIVELLAANYVREVWLSEFPSDGVKINTVEIADAVVEGRSKPDEIDDRTWIKLENIHLAVRRYIIDRPLSSTSELLSVDFIKDVHATVGGNNLVPNCGSFRTKNVTASQSSVIYAQYPTIRERLGALVSFLNEAGQAAPTDPNPRLLYMIRLGSFFFSEFLLIHPFDNGNGRTARILLNIVLRQSVVVPFSLYVQGREQYIEVLEKRNNRSPPSALATFVLLACNTCAATINWLALKGDVAI
jgi:fido (protein-threonine AMPylation protein)